MAFLIFLPLFLIFAAFLLALLGGAIVALVYAIIIKKKAIKAVLFSASFCLFTAFALMIGAIGYSTQGGEYGTARKSDTLITSLASGDKDTLKSLFCERARNQSTFDDDIDELFAFFKCDSLITHKSGLGGSSFQSGGDHFMDKSIDNIEVAFENINGETQTLYYRINYGIYIRNTDPTRVGITDISIVVQDSNGNDTDEILRIDYELW